MMKLKGSSFAIFAVFALLHARSACFCFGFARWRSRLSECLALPAAPLVLATYCWLAHGRSSWACHRVVHRSAFFFLGWAHHAKGLSIAVAGQLCCVIARICSVWAPAREFSLCKHVRSMQLMSGE